MSHDELSGEPVELIVTEEFAGCRLDWYLARQFPAYSRVFLRRVINAAAVRVDGKREKASHALKAGQVVSLSLPELPRQGPRPENIPLDILYEDEHLAAINKPPGMVVHPAKGHWSGTLTAALAYHFNSLSQVGGATRPGIVHRLDRDTSGVILVAKNDPAHIHLARQFEDRTVEKEYAAIVAGVPDRDRDRIDAPIDVHPTQREKMAIRPTSGTARPAQSFYEVVERFRGFATVRVLPKTGRTHQIRVHLASIGCAVLCDKQYGGRSRITRGEITGRAEEAETVVLERQALHARRIEFTHPILGTRMTVEAPLAPDLQQVIELLKQSHTA
ncbi:MAG: RluA family pseudouridine synthase [Pirellulales bacterium]|nr:RluA family pseudouridine synthase [Pirellulales bacterium]